MKHQSRIWKRNELWNKLSSLAKAIHENACAHGWHDEENDPTPFIRYMLQVILACYTDFEERVGIMTDTGYGSTAYDIVKR